MKKTLLSAAIGLATQTAFAAEALDILHIEATNEIGLTNSASRINEADSSAIIDAEDIEARQANNFSEIMQHVPSVMVEQQSGQQGSIIYVRGMRGDQVSVRVDGAPKNFTQTRHGGTDALYLDTNMYKTVSVIPGVSSNTYGSGSLGGVVLIETKDPEDIIKEDKSWGAALRYGHETNGQANTLSADLAKRFSDTFSANATITGKQFDPYKDGQGVSSEEGHTGTDDLGLLLKGVITPSSEHRIELSTLTNTKEYTAPGGGSSTSVYDTEILDRTYAAEYNFTPTDIPWINLDARISQATTERDRKTYQSDEDWTTWGVTTNFLEFNNTSEFEQSERIFHVIKVGADYTHDDITSAYTSSTTGDLLKRKRTTKGAYLSESMHFDDALILGASLRYDEYEAEQNGKNLEGKSSTSPKINALWTPFESSQAHGLGFTAVVGQGYRAPSVFESFGRNDGQESCSTRRGVTSCSVTLANESLKGESSDSYEAGIVFNRTGAFKDSDSLNIKLNYVHNDIKNLIASDEIGSYTNSSGDTVTRNQYTNLDNAVIFGWEASIDYANDIWFTALTWQSLDGWEIGSDGTRSELIYFSPSTFNTRNGVFFNEGKGQLGFETVHRSGRENSNLAESWRRHAYTYYNLFGSYQVNDQLSVQARVDNVTDELYTIGSKSEENGVDTTNYAAGRNMKVSLNFTF